MADIDQIIAGGAGASSRANFSGFDGIPDAFYKARDQKYQQEGRDLFKGGLPTTPDGQPDFAAMGKALFQHGDIGQGTALSNLDLQRQQLRYGQSQSADIARFEGGQPPASPPSPNRTASATVAPPLNRGGVNNTGSAGATPQQGGTTLTQVVAASGIPNDQVQAVSSSLGRQLGVEDPNQPIDTNDPQVRNVLVPALQRFKQAGIGQVAQDGQQPPAQPQPQAPPPQAAPQQAQPPAPQGQPGPVTDRLTSAAPSEPSRADKAIAFYMGIMTNPMSPKANVEAAKSRLEALQKSAELTPTQKEYSQAVLQGYRGTQMDYQTEIEQRKTAGTEEAKIGAQKYNTLVESGVKAQQEIPQLELLQNQMNDPNFYSGVGEKYNLAFKRLKAAVGMEPDAAVPQEVLRKATAAAVLGSFGALKGLGPIRVAEMNLAKQAAAAPENSIPANKLLVELQKRTYQRQADIAEMAQDYKEKNGVLDAGFDKQVTAYFKAHPMLSDAEINDYHKAIGEAPKAAEAAEPGAPMQGARKAPDGNWYVPDPNRPGKYAKVVQ